MSFSPFFKKNIMSKNLKAVSDTIFASRVIQAAEQGLIGKQTFGLGNVDDTSDLAKPVSLATQAALDGKQNTLQSELNIKSLNGNSLLEPGVLTVDKTFVGLANVDNTSDVDKPVSAAVAALLSAAYVPSTRQINGQTLAANIALKKADIEGRVLSVATNTVLTQWEQVVLANCSNSNLTITLPPAAEGKSLVVIKTDASENSLSVVPSLGQVLNAAANPTLSQQYEVAQIFSSTGECFFQSSSGAGGGGGGTGVDPLADIILSANVNQMARASVHVNRWRQADLDGTGIINCTCDEHGFPDFIRQNSAAQIVLKPCKIRFADNTIFNLTNDLTFSPPTTMPVNIFAENSGIVATTDPFSIYTERRFSPSCMYFNFENDEMYDMSSETVFFNLTANRPTISTSQSRFGTRSLAVPNNAQIDAGLERLSITSTFVPAGPSSAPVWQVDFWIYPTAVWSAANAFFFRMPENAQIIIELRSGSVGSTMQLRAFSGNSGAGFNGANNLAVGNALVVNQWNYVRIRFNTQLEFFVNGAGTLAPNNNIPSSPFCLEFYNSNFGSTYFLDEIIFTPFFRDNSSSPLDLALISTPGLPYASRLNGASLNDEFGFQWQAFSTDPARLSFAATTFGGEPAVQLTNNALFTSQGPVLKNANQWTIEFWFRTATGRPSSCGLFDMRVRNMQSFLLEFSGNNIVAFVSSDGSSNNLINGGTVASNVLNNVWYHLAISFSTNFGLRFFFNGTQSALANSSALAGLFLVGQYHILSNHLFNPLYSGDVAQFRITPAVVYTSNFTPTNLLPAIISQRNIDLSTGKRTLRGANASLTPTNCEYLGTLFKSPQLARHNARRMNIYASLRTGEIDILKRDGTLIEQRFRLPNNYDHSMAGTQMALVLNDNRIVVCGRNPIANGLGVAQAANSLIPYIRVQINNNKNEEIKFLCQGRQSFGFVTENNFVYFCGQNLDGGFGNGSASNNFITPTMTYAGSNITHFFIMSRIGLASSMCSFLIDNGNLLACGSNTQGQLGVGTTANVLTWTTVPKIGGQDWRGIYSCGSQTYAWSGPNKTLYACGNNTQGNLGIGTITGTISSMTACQTLWNTPIINVSKVYCAIDGSQVQTFVLTDDGTLYSSGKIRTDLTVPTAIGVPGAANWTSHCGATFVVMKRGVRDFVINSRAILILTNERKVYVSGIIGFTYGTNPDLVVNTLQNEVYLAEYGTLNTADKVFGNAGAENGVTLSSMGISTLDGELFLCGNQNTVQNSLGSSSINASVMQYRVDIDKCEEVYFYSTLTTAGTIIKTAAESIYTCGSAEVADNSITPYFKRLREV
jgi:alpha-tubulin suppressor-like RCC1 family protein